MSGLRDLRQLLELAAYHEVEIDRILDPDTPCFIDFDPVLGYMLNDLNQQLVQSPYSAEITLPIPDEPSRLEFIRSFVKGHQFSKNSEVSQTVLLKNGTREMMLQKRQRPRNRLQEPRMVSLV